ncbi:biotin--[acetyl-CoA-carboxylase] ligase [Bacteroidia bacterium]|nr:biotin--[acetyl-CoA-carboxylase] ligase [Bacteroidia bacterium]
MNIIRIQATDSTNRHLKKLSDGDPHLPEGTTLVASVQTAGRGQAGNGWEAEAGKNLTFSVLLYPRFLSAGQHFLLSEAVALAVVEPLKMDARVKWPNDIYVGDRKMAGILIENDWQGDHIRRSIVGIGLNVNQLEFTSDAPNPISIKQITGADTDLDALLGEILQHIYKVYKQLDDCRGGDLSRPIVAQMYAEKLYRKTGFFDFADKNGIFRAEIQSVSDDGRLHLATADGELRAYAFKEVAFRT